jgi:hypothetical protein
MGGLASFDLQQFEQFGAGHQQLSAHTTVRILKGANTEIFIVYGPVVPNRGCERLEVFMRFSPSMSFARLPGYMPENLFSPNSPT